MEDFSALPRKEKLKEYRRRAKEVQCRKEGHTIEGYMHCAKKMGKLDAMEKHLDNSIYHEITREEGKLWDQVVQEMIEVGGRGFYCARIVENPFKKV
jgi:hypothetical protein